jgi:hypothetical protein
LTVALRPLASHVRTALPLALVLVAVFTEPASASRILWQRGFGYQGWGYNEGRAGDFNADGFGDFLFAVPSDDYFPSPNFGWLHLILGAQEGTPFQELLFVGRKAGAKLGIFAGHAGDLNGDGYDDIVAVQLNGLQQEIVLFRGNAPPDTSVDLVVPWISSTSLYSTPPTVLAGVGDVNGDGYDDLAVGNPDNPASSPNRGRVSLFFGGPAFDGTPDLILDGTSAGDRFGAAIAGGRDFDGDGYTDLAVGAPDVDGPAGTNAGEMRLYRGGPGLDAIADGIFKGGASGGELGSFVDFLADFNGDGHADLVAGSLWNAPHGILVFRGGPAFDTTPDWRVVEGFGGRGGDDVNHDGFSDVLVAFTEGTVPGSYVYFGGTNPDTIPDTPLSTWPYYFEFTRGPAVPAGDVNGDGWAEWLVNNSYGGIHPGNEISLFTARPAVPVGVDPPSGTLRMAISPSPARPTDILTMTIPALSGPAGPVNDVAVQVLDVSGREVGRLTPGRGPGAGSFQWVPAQHGVRSGIYFLRVRSSAAGFDRALKFVVVD